jgi:hypothetical protein
MRDVPVSGLSLRKIDSDTKETDLSFRTEIRSGVST